MLIFFVSIVVLAGVSYLTEPPEEKAIAGLTFATVSPEQKRQTRASWNRWDVINSGIVLLAIRRAYLYFNG